MIEITNVVAPSAETFDAVFEGMRNPLNSWDKSDSQLICNIPALVNWDGAYEHGQDYPALYPKDADYTSTHYLLGPGDLNLAKRLISAGPEHAKFLRQLPVVFTITAPLYFWKQLDTYKIGTTANSCSTMHKLTEKEFTLSDFSLGELGDENYYIESGSVGVEVNIFVGSIIRNLNALRDRYIETGDKRYWHAINRLLPQSYNQKRTWSTNYAQLFTYCAQRAGHKLEEHNEFIEFILGLPYFRTLCYDALCNVSPGFNEVFGE